MTDTLEPHESHHKKKPRGHCTCMLYGLTTAAGVLAGLLESLYFWPFVGRRNRPSCKSAFESAIWNKLYYLSNFCGMQAQPRATISGAGKM